jgi:hypothetical protein
VVTTATKVSAVSTTDVYYYYIYGAPTSKTHKSVTFLIPKVEITNYEAQLAFSNRYIYIKIHKPTPRGYRDGTCGQTN